MLDKRCLKLLDIINGECLNSGYKVIDISAVIAAMPASFGMDEENIRECLEMLSAREYVSVKYEDDKEVCLCPTPKGRLVFENRIDDEIAEHRSRKYYFFYAFLGSAAGGAFAALLAVLILILGGR